jgi:hypothetical protein
MKDKNCKIIKKIMDEKMNYITIDDENIYILKNIF